MRWNFVLGVSALSLACSTQAQLLFTEYVEGSSNNKAVELTNTGDSAINLDSGDYRIELYTNSNVDVGQTQVLSGTLAAGQSQVFFNSGGADALKAQGIASTITYFNGNDSLVLLEGDTVLDRIGQLAGNTNWSANGVTTKDQTLRRRVPYVAETDHTLDFDPSLNWVAFAKDTFDGLGCAGLEACAGTPEPDPLPELGSCGDTDGVTLISAIQGADDSSPLEDQRVIIEGIVTADFQGDEQSAQLKGFFVQEELADQDSDSSTSEGVFVYYTDVDVAVGDSVRLMATVAEYYDNTQLKNVDQLAICSSENSLPAAVDVTLPLADDFAMESVEGMRVNFPQTLHATLSYNFGRYGELVLSNGKLIKPTQLHPAGSAEAIALQAHNDRNRITVDDGSTAQNPEVISYFPQLSAEVPLRSGSEVSNFEGAIYYSFGEYKLHPTQVPTFVDANPRTDAPELAGEGNLKVASFNVLNYFTDLESPDNRGADSANELQRQQDKLVAALVALDADIVGLMELENDGFGEGSALATLVSALNSELSDTELHYAAVTTGGALVGNDAITVGLIYRPAAVELVGDAEMITAYPFDEATAKHRVPLVQRFSHIASGDELTVAVNHFKSKGSSCEALGDPEDENGQGNCNGQRVEAAQTLSDYFTEQGVSNVLLLGDFNAYAQEDPMQVFATEGYTNLATHFHADAYSYYYDEEAGSLDHILASADLLTHVLDATDWHINADEARSLDYNTEYKSELQQINLYNADPFRASDHDPVVVALTMGEQPQDEEPQDEEPKDEESKGGFGSGGWLLLSLLGLMAVGRRR